MVDISCDQRVREEGENISEPHTLHPMICTHIKQSQRYSIKAYVGKCPSQKWWAGTLSLTVDYTVEDSSLFLYIIMWDQYF